jgi:hypothetical protein
MGYTAYELGLETIDVKSGNRKASYCQPDLCLAWVTRMSFSASCHMYLVSIYDRSMIKASIVNHPFKEIKSVLHSRITSGSNALRRGQSSLVSYDSNEERPSPDIN